MLRVEQPSQGTRWTGTRSYKEVYSWISIQNDWRPSKKFNSRGSQMHISMISWLIHRNMHIPNRQSLESSKSWASKNVGKVSLRAYHPSQLNPNVPNQGEIGIWLSSTTTFEQISVINWVFHPLYPQFIDHFSTTTQPLYHLKKVHKPFSRSKKDHVCIGLPCQREQKICICFPKETHVLLLISLINSDMEKCNKEFVSQKQNSPQYQSWRLQSHTNSLCSNVTPRTLT